MAKDWLSKNGHSNQITLVEIDCLNVELQKTMRDAVIGRAFVRKGT